MPDSNSSVSLRDALSRPAAYPHPVRTIEVIETHISWVFLTGDYAYKVKKPVDLGFVDFTTLEARRRYCEDELTLNRRLAADLYLEVVEIRSTAQGPCIGGSGPVVDHAVRMRQFAQDALASRLLAAGALTPALVTGLAATVAGFHANLPGAGADSPYGRTCAFIGNALRNFDEIAPLLDDEEDAHALAALRDWTEREAYAISTRMHERRAAGMVRECHGDLHLSNIVRIGERLVPFDCIEFNADFRWNDVVSEAAFVVMDLAYRGAPQLAWLFLDRYLEATGDYSGVPVLRFYVAYRAMVRAKIHLIRARQSGAPAERARLTEAYRSYVRFASAWAHDRTGAIVLMHGFSGSGKSTVAGALAAEIGAIRVRSDVERKRLSGVAPLERGGRIYGADTTAATYERLAEAAGEIAAAGYVAIADATFLERAHRDRFRALARGQGVDLLVLDVAAPPDVLRARVLARAREAHDASDATLSVLEAQMANAAPLGEDELDHVVSVDGATGYEPALARTVVRALGKAER